MKHLVRLIAGVLIGDAIGLAAWALHLRFNATPDPLGLGSGPSLLTIPALVGVVAAWIWKPLRLSIGFTLLASLLCAVVGLACGFYFFGEGTVCLIIISPILFANLALSALVARMWFMRNDGTLNVCAIPLFMAALFIEPHLRAEATDVVVDQIHINAPPSKVWPHVLAFEPINAPPSFWLFSFGLPFPVATTNGGNFVGAERACIFSDNATFKEKIAEFDPPRLLTFDIIEQPADPELLGHLNSHRGQFELRDNGDGTTTLIGRTWYSLHVRPAWYFDWWTHKIFRAVHLRVMDNVKSLSEKP